MISQSGSGAADDAFEQSLIRQEYITLPDSGGLVMPLCCHEGASACLVGLLVVERTLLPPPVLTSQPNSPDQPTAEVVVHKGEERWQRDDGEAAGSPELGLGQLFSQQDAAALQMVAQAIGLACAMDLRAALERAQHLLNRVQVLCTKLAVQPPLKVLRLLAPGLCLHVVECRQATK